MSTKKIFSRYEENEKCSILKITFVNGRIYGKISAALSFSKWFFIMLTLKPIAKYRKPMFRTFCALLKTSTVENSCFFYHHILQWPSYYCSNFTAALPNKNYTIIVGSALNDRHTEKTALVKFAINKFFCFLFFLK